MNTGPLVILTRPSGHGYTWVADCGCSVRTIPTARHTVRERRWLSCPLHTAAADLLAALEDLLHVIPTMGTCPTPDDDRCPHAEAIRRANAAIFAAKGDVEA